MDRAVPGTSFGHISALDGVRGIAVMLVLLHHSNLLTDGAGGSVGVSLFFVLSGYLITSLLVAERSRTGSLNLGRFFGEGSSGCFHLSLWSLASRQEVSSSQATSVKPSAPRLERAAM